MQVYFLRNFSKKIPSTKQANTTGAAARDVALLAPCSMLSPVIQLAHDTNYAGYNYAYIPDWGRYYYVRDWDYTNALATAHLECDVLASFRTAILASTQMVVRCSAKCNPDIPDTTRITTAALTTAGNGTNILRTYASSYDGGVYIVGIISGAIDLGRIGAVTYYVMTQGELNRIMKLLLTNTQYLDIDDSTLSESMQKMLFSPLQYIVSCMWLPLATDQIPNTTRLTSIPVGWWSFTATAGLLPTADNGNIFHSSKLMNSYIQIPRHPQLTSNARWLKRSPYSQYLLTCYPFCCNLAIDDSMIYNANYLDFDLVVDIVSGNSWLYIDAYEQVPTMTPNNSWTVAILQNQLGVQIPLAQITQQPIPSDVLRQYAVMGGIDIAKSAISGAKNAGGNLFSALGGAVNAAWDTAGDVLDNGLALVSNGQQVCQTSGGTPCAGIIPMSVDLQCYFASVTPDANQFIGRPLMETHVLADFSGAYVRTVGAQISISGVTADEENAVCAALNSGIWLE